MTLLLGISFNSSSWIINGDQYHRKVPIWILPEGVSHNNLSWLINGDMFKLLGRYVLWNF